MYMNTESLSIDRTITDLLFHQDPEARFDAALHLGGWANGVSGQRRVLEALTTALHDPCATVQEAVLQSLVRLSVKPE